MQIAWEELTCFYCLFQQVNVSLNHLQVSQSSRTYAYRAYIESLLSYGPKKNAPNLPPLCTGPKRTLSATWIALILITITNRRKMFDCRREHCLQKKRPSTWFGNIFSRSIHVKRGQCQSSTREKQRLDLSYVQKAVASYKVKIISAVLLVRKVHLIPSVFLIHAKAIISGLEKYHTRRGVVCKTYTITSSKLDGNHELFPGQLPSRLVICVDNADNGLYTKFKNFAERNFFTSEWKYNQSDRWNQTTAAISTSRHT